MSSIIERLGEAGALAGVHAADRSIGRLLLDAGKLKPGDAERALRLAREKGIRFGEACVQLKLLRSTDVDWALSRQFDYPYLQPGGTELSNELIAAYRPFSAQVEAMRALRTQLLLRWFSTERRMLAIVSPSRGDGRSYLAANLAIVFSQLGERTLLIDCDLRNARQHMLFKVPNQYGLSAVLSGRMNDLYKERVSQFKNLSLVPAGALPPNPLELISRPEFKEFLVEECGNYDIVLLDTPAAGVYADSLALAAGAGGALLVARKDRSRVASMRRLAASLQGTQTVVVGSVLN